MVYYHIFLFRMSVLAGNLLAFKPTTNYSVCHRSCNDTTTALTSVIFLEQKATFLFVHMHTLHMLLYLKVQVNPRLTLDSKCIHMYESELWVVG